MRKKFVAVGIIISSFLCWSLFQKPEPITKINSFKEIAFDRITLGTLVAFDVDETLIQPTDAFLINEHCPQAQTFKQKLMQDNQHIKDWDAIMSTLLVQAERPSLEPAIITAINELKQRGIPVIALTAMNTGSLGHVLKLEEWRYNQLKALGFEGSFEDQIFTLDSFKRHPVFYRGILAVDLESKGEVLGAFLDYTKLPVHKIVMIDDCLEMLESVQKECKERGIAFEGYHYLNAKSKEWDEELAQFQADYLIKYNKWLNDEAAMEMMRTHTSVPLNILY